MGVAGIVIVESGRNMNKSQKAWLPFTAHWRPPRWSGSWSTQYERKAQKNCISWRKGQQSQSQGGILLLSIQWKAQRWRQTLLRGAQLLNKTSQVQVATLKIAFKHLKYFLCHEGAQTLEQNPETLRRNLQPWRSSKLYWTRPWAIVAGPALDLQSPLLTCMSLGIFDSKYQSFDSNIYRQNKFIKITHFRNFSLRGDIPRAIIFSFSLIPPSFATSNTGSLTMAKQVVCWEGSVSCCPALFLYVEPISCPLAYTGIGLSLGRGHHSTVCFSSSNCITALVWGNRSNRYLINRKNKTRNHFCYNKVIRVRVWELFSLETRTELFFYK